MAKINQIENAILELEGGKYQKLMNSYIYKRFGYSNITPLGSETGTDKPTKGTPDAYICLDNKKYIFIMYGTTKFSTFKKIQNDINDCLDEQKTGITVDNIDTIICCHTSSNITVDQNKSILLMFNKIILIGISELSQDLYFKYQNLAKEYLSINIDSNQIFNDEDFIKENDKNGFSTSLDMPLLYRDNDKNNLYDLIKNQNVLLIWGASGIGKTRLALEVAREFSKKNNYILKIIKNNGEQIYEDLKSNFIDDNDYIVFVDDANQLVQLEHLLRMSVDKDRQHKIIIIATVRDYAKKFLSSRIKNITQPKEYEIKPLSDENIKNILMNNLKIKNIIYLDQIINIAKGNIRLAIMAGVCALQDGAFENIRNAFDIFDRFYSEIVFKMERKKIILTALIAFFDSFKLTSEEIIYKLALDNNINKEEFNEYIYELHKEEIVDIYDDLALKFENQNLNDYILYYVLFKEKWLKIKDIIVQTFPIYKGRIIHTINTLIQLFYTDENISYLKYEVQKAYNELKKDQNIMQEFIENFHFIIPDETLCFIKKSINNLSEFKIEFLTFDFEKSKNNHQIKSSLLNILCNYKHTENFKEALDLIILYINKNTENPMDFYFIFKEELSIDKKSHLNDYYDEKEIIQFLYNKYKETHDENILICLLFYIETCLKFEFERTEGSYKSNVINIITYHILNTKGAKELRELAINILFEVYKNDLYKNKILKILISYCKNNSDNEILTNDLNLFEKKFQQFFYYTNFNECIIIYHFYNIKKKLSSKKTSSFFNWHNNKIFCLYTKLKLDIHNLKKYKDIDIIRKKNIINIINEMSLINYNQLFYELNNDIIDDKNDWSLTTSLNLMFKLYDKKNFVTIIEYYIKNETPFNAYPEYIIPKLIEILGYCDTRNFINSFKFNNKKIWLCTLNTIIPDKFIDLGFIQYILCDLNDCGNINIEKILTLKSIIRINGKFPNFIIDYFKIITIGSNNFSSLANKLINESLNDELYKELILLFSNDTIILQDMYLLALSYRAYADYKGDLLLELINQDEKFLFKVIDSVIEGKCNENILRALWNHANYLELINVSFDYIINKNNDRYIIFININHLFEDCWKDGNLEKKLVNWVIEFIKNYNKDSEKMCYLFYCISNSSKEIRKHSIMEFCKNNDSLEIFKCLSFEPSGFSWSGSEVPVIENRIEFLEELKAELKGINFIEHCKFLSEQIHSLQKYKENILLNEFLELR